MKITDISRDNYQLLSQLRPGQNIGFDRSGRVYLIDSQSILTNVVRKIFQDKKELQQIVQSFVIDKLHERQFHDVKQGRNLYLSLLNQFANNQLSDTQKSAIAFDYYNGRYRDLVANGMESFRAECQIVLEMTNDPNIFAKFKNDIAPEVTDACVYLKDRAGRKIAILNQLTDPISEAIPLKN